MYLNEYIWILLDFQMFTHFCKIMERTRGILHRDFERKPITMLPEKSFSKLFKHCTCAELCVKE